MTNDERKRIERLRKNGNSFSRIAEITGLSRDSVRMYCSRNNIVPEKSGETPAASSAGRNLRQTPEREGRLSSAPPAAASPTGGR